MDLKPLFEQRICPSWKACQGDIEFVGINVAGFVTVRIRGGCANCPTAQRILIECVEAELEREGVDFKGVLLEC